MATYKRTFGYTIMPSPEIENLKMIFSLTESPVYGYSRIANFTIKSFTNKGTKAE